MKLADLQQQTNLPFPEFGNGKTLPKVEGLAEIVPELSPGGVARAERTKIFVFQHCEDGRTCFRAETYQLIDHVFMVIAFFTDSSSYHISQDADFVVKDGESLRTATLHDPEVAEAIDAIQALYVLSCV